MKRYLFVFLTFMFALNLYSEIIHLTLQVGETYYILNKYTSSYSISSPSTNEGSIVSVYSVLLKHPIGFVVALIC